MRAVRNLDFDTALKEAEQRYVRANGRSQARHEKAKGSLPGGNTRAVLYYPPFPVALDRGEGCHVWDLDGKRYADFVCEYSAGLYGHTDPVIREAVIEALGKGIVLGAPNRYEAQLSELLVQRFPALDLVRFCNSGTEANIMALSTARAVTGRPKIMVFREGYHGGVLTYAHGGSVLNVPFPLVFADYNDIDGTIAAIRKHKDELAAVIIEPMMAGGGCIPGDPAFMSALRDETERHGIVLIFDEVVTSRLSPRGLQGVLGITPDMMSIGKYLGGGLSFGAFGGAVRIMERFDPTKPNAFSHGGTFNNAVLTMAAGAAGLSRVFTPEAALVLNKRGDRLRTRLQKSIAARDVPMTVVGVGSVMNIHFVRGPVRTPKDLEGARPNWLKLLQLELLQRGQYMTSRGMLALSLPMTDQVVDEFAAAVEGFIDDYADLLRAA
ncbi:MAG: aminotransferase class III-fold pyridoxal phosphate-dependent enzyme [Alphaproteobacteria bacterium]|nr:aminotransferase class III-fold pyridoxal phosphate-dependent enzyme [Alphaproteobacteria bacterium]